MSRVKSNTDLAQPTNMGEIRVTKGTDLTPSGEQTEGFYRTTSPDTTPADSDCARDDPNERYHGPVKSAMWHM